MKAQRRSLFLENGALLQEQLISLSGGRYCPFRIFSSKEIAKLTNDYHPHNKLRNHRLGIWYKGSFEGRNVFVCRSELLNSNTENRRMLSRIKRQEADKFVNDIAMTALLSAHRNILRLIGCCLEVSVPLLVYESADVGCLSDQIYDLDSRRSQPMPWKSTLKIAREIAHTVAYLHTAFPRPIVHKNIKPSNVFLDEHNTAKLSNFSESIAIPEDKPIILSRLVWTHGYASPEFLHNWELTEKFDVYCLGTFLLEILTGRDSSILRQDFRQKSGLSDSETRHIQGHFSQNYLKYFASCHSIDEIVDQNVVARGGGSHEMKQCHAVAELALSCLETIKENRPTMVEVTKRLLQIERSLNIVTEFASCDCSCDIANKFSAEELKIATNNYDLDYIIKCSSFGIWYMGSLRDKSVSVCKLNTFTWQNHVNNEFKLMAELGGHHNVLRLIGCCLETPVPIVVYDSAENGSLHNQIYSNYFREPFVGPLPKCMLWYGRLKIASQIANGVAYLHSALGRPIIHGNITAANILLDEHYVPKVVAQFSISALESETLLRFKERNMAQEDDTVTEKFDVYCFGMLTLQLLLRCDLQNLESSFCRYGDFYFWRTNGSRLMQYLKYHMRCHYIDDVVDPRILMEEGVVDQQNINLQWKDVVELILKCLEVEKEKRPMMTEVATQLEEIERSSVVIERDISVTGSSVFFDKFGTSCMLNPFRVFSAVELKQATTNYDPKHIFSCTNLGIWYKGQLGKQKFSICKINQINGQRHVKNELDIAAKLHGRKNVLKLLGCCMETPIPVLVYEEVRRECLFIGNRYGEVPFNSMIKIAKYVAREVAHLHTAFSPPIIHKNIKSANIFLDKHNNPKLCNFSEAISTNVSECPMTCEVGRIKAYLAPECMNEGVVTDKVDIYGYGVILFELLRSSELHDLFELVEEGELLLDILKSSFNFPRIDDEVKQMVARRKGGPTRHQQWKDVIELAFKCLKTEKEERPSASEIVRLLKRI